MRRRLFAFTLLAILALTAVISANLVRSAPLAHPLPFNHRAHAEADITCDFCHAHTQRYESAGVPAVSECLDCHASMEDRSGVARVLQEHLDAGRELAWPAVFVTSRWNRFSHRAHARARIPCGHCHGDIGTSERLPARRIQLAMGWCVDCHRERAASTDCLTCHR